MAITKKQPRLGRGLSSLIGNPVQVSITPPPSTPPVSDEVSSVPLRATTVSDQDATKGDHIVHVFIESIKPNPNQPRQHFDPAALQQLADSIRTAGLMQPILVRKLASATPGLPTSYELIAGERRWRAAKLAGLETVPAVVHSLSDGQAAEWALIENLQREDLNPIERAHAFQQLMDRFALSNEQVAQRVGLDRSSVANTVRLLGLANDVQQMVIDGLLSAGQARAIAAIQDQEVQVSVAKQAVRRQWSVRQLEAEVRRISGGAEAPKKGGAVRPQAHLADLEQQLGQQLTTRVRIRQGRRKGTGTLMIEFHSLDQFDAILARLGVTTQ